MSCIQFRAVRLHDHMNGCMAEFEASVEVAVPERAHGVQLHEDRARARDDTSPAVARGAAGDPVAGDPKAPPANPRGNV
eukprot:3974037-Alexandrium_andersonii.AAC.1